MYMYSTAVQLAIISHVYDHSSLYEIAEATTSAGQSSQELILRLFNGPFEDGGPPNEWPFRDRRAQVDPEQICRRGDGVAQGKLCARPAGWGVSHGCSSPLCWPEQTYSALRTLEFLTRNSSEARRAILRFGQLLVCGGNL
jgi:hypothetical protein